MPIVRVYTVKGIGPAGDLIEVSIVADSSIEARRKAHEAGLQRVVIGVYHEVEERDAPPPDEPTP